MYIRNYWILHLLAQIIFILLVAYAMVANLQLKMEYLSMPTGLFGILNVSVAFVVGNLLL